MKSFVISSLCAAAASAEAYYGSYGYAGLSTGYGGAYTTGLRSIAAPVYGYSTPAYTTGYAAGYGYGKRSAEADSDAEAYYGNYGYGLGAGLGYGASYGAGYGGAYTTGVRAIASPVYGLARPAYTTGYTGYGYGKRSAEAEAYYGNYGYGLGAGLGYSGAYTTGVRTIASPVYGLARPAYTTGYAGYGYSKRSAEADSDAEAYYGNYGYGLGAGLGYTGAYSTGLRSIAAPVYGYSTPAYTTGYGYGRGIWKREADAESDPQSWYGNYGLAGGLGYGGYGSYATATIARPVYGYANLGYSGYGAGSYGLY